MSEKDTFHITVGAVDKPGMEIESGTRLLRTALLYADKVKLCSASMGMVLQKFKEYNLGDLEYLLWAEEDLISRMPDGQKKAEFIEKLKGYKYLAKKREKGKRFNTRDKEALAGLKEKQDYRRAELLVMYPVVGDHRNLRGIQKAIEIGLLDLHSFETLNLDNLATKHYAGQDTGDAADIVNEYLETVIKQVSSGTTYPFFDDTTNTLVKAAFDQGKKILSDFKISQATHSAFTQKTFERLPDFSEAPIADLIDIRADIQQYLDSFRVGMLEYASFIKSAPWDNDFASEANQVFTKKVTPSVLALEDLIKSSRGRFSYSWVEMNKARVGFAFFGVIGMIVSSLSSLPAIASIGLADLVPLSISINEGVKNWANEQRNIESHTMYFYYQLREKLKDRVDKQPWES